MKKILKALLILILSVVVILALLAVSFRLLRNVDGKEQAVRLERLEQSVPERFTIPDTEIDDSIPLNHVRYLATHNSYRRRAGLLQKIVLEIFQPGESASLDYSHPDFYSQLDIGVRSFEVDLRYYGKDRFGNIHVPLVDNRSHSPSFEAALSEMRLWSERHPQHIPLIVIMETKQDWMFLDPAQKKWTADALTEADRLISSKMKDLLFTPDDLRNGYGSVLEAVSRNGWPELGEVRGKFIFVFHESDGSYFNEEYLGSEDRVSFFMVQPDSPEAAFMLRNDPFDQEIGSLVKKGFIVRTRADADCMLSGQRKDAAIASGAQIVSTDFPRGYAGGGDYSLGWRQLLRGYVY